MNEILLDTHALVWLLEDDPRFDPESKALAVEALGKGELIVSTFSLLGNRHAAPEEPLHRPADPK